MRNLSLVFFLVLSFTSVAAAADKYLYKAYDKNNLQTFERSRIHFDHSDSGVIKAVFESGPADYSKKEEYTFDKNYGTLSWKISDPQGPTEYTGRKEKQKIIFEGTFNGRPVSKKADIDTSGPFFAFPKYELTPFALGDQKKLTFWALRNDTLEVFKMLAIHQGEKTISVNGKMVNAKKITWSPANPLFRIFKRTYYYRASDGIFLKQEYPDGRVRELVGEE